MIWLQASRESLLPIGQNGIYLHKQSRTQQVEASSAISSKNWSTIPDRVSELETNL